MNEELPLDVAVYANPVDRDELTNKLLELIRVFIYNELPNPA